jgi:hypothetical protein
VAAPFDVIVKTHEEMTRIGGVPASLEAEFLERGREIYGRGRAGTDPELAHEGVA